jgi:hypothetical protein
LTLEEALDVIGAVRPAIIYLTVQNFELADELGDARERLATLGVTSDPPALRGKLIDTTGDCARCVCFLEAENQTMRYNLV